MDSCDYVSATRLYTKAFPPEPNNRTPGGGRGRNGGRGGRSPGNSTDNPSIVSRESEDGKKPGDGPKIIRWKDKNNRCPFSKIGLPQIKINGTFSSICFNCHVEGRKCTRQRCTYIHIPVKQNKNWWEALKANHLAKFVQKVEVSDFVEWAPNMKPPGTMILKAEDDDASKMSLLTKETSATAASKKKGEEDKT